MAFAGLKKQINKANQYMTEKMGGAEGTQMDDEFMDMEKKTDVTYELVEDLQVKTKEFLQPNPSARAKMAAVKGISKLSGQAKASTYPQPEGVLGECMTSYGRKLGDDSMFGVALVEMGESMKQMADVKYSLDDNIKQNFLEPLHHLQTKDLKEVMHHRKKLQGRRLDFDCKRRKQAKGHTSGGKKAGGGGLSAPNYGSPAKSPAGTPGGNFTDEEIKQSEDKFAESLHLAQMGMYNLLENDVEQISQLATFAEGLVEYHEQCTVILKDLVEILNEKRDEAANRPKTEFTPKTLADLNIEGISEGINGAGLPHSYPPTASGQYGQSGAPPSLYPDLDPWQAAQSRASQSSASQGRRGSWQSAPRHPPKPTGSSQASTPVHAKPSQLELFPPGQEARSTNASPLPSPMRSPARTPMTKAPSCTAIYDFEPENPGELGFKEGDTITLVNKIDENWFEGSINGKTGYFPQSYVQVVVPLP